jgi:hypothetical protein
MIQQRAVVQFEYAITISGYLAAMSRDDHRSMDLVYQFIQQLQNALGSCIIQIAS